MLRKDVAAACLAPLAIALRRFAEFPNIFFSPRNSHVFRLRQGEGIYGSRRPMAARIAMTIAMLTGSPVTVNWTAPQKQLPS